jgi:tetratricopeptide (TPR) repeat protein
MRTLVLAVSAIPLLAQAPQQVPHIRSAQLLFIEASKARHENNMSVAVTSFRKAIQIEPTFLEAREGLIAAYGAVGESLQEATAITEYLEIKPESDRYRLRLGQILFAQKQSEKALAQFALVLKRQPDCAEALLGFASAAASLGMHDRAAHATAHGREKYPADTRFRKQQP